MSKAPAEKATPEQIEKGREEKRAVLAKRLEMLDLRANIVEAKVRIAEGQAKLDKLIK